MTTDGARPPVAMHRDAPSPFVIPDHPVSVLVASPSVGRSNVDRIREAIPAAHVDHRPCESASELMRSLDARTEVVLAELLPASTASAPCLKWIQLLSAGVDVFAADRVWRESDVSITTASGIHAPAMSEYIVATMLYRSQRLHVAATFKETRSWDDPARPSGSPVAGKTLGVLGYGSVGRRTARIAHALGMKVMAVRRTPKRRSEEQYRWGFVRALDASPDPALVLTMTELPRLLREADVLVVTLPLTPDTRHLIGTYQFELMKPTSMIINVSRGGIFDESALIDALAERRIAFAALDVFAAEPLPVSSPLFELPNVMLTPHVSGVFSGYFDVATDLFIANLGRYLRGERLLNLADRTRGY